MTDTLVERFFVEADEGEYCVFQFADGEYEIRDLFGYYIEVDSGSGMDRSFYIYPLVMFQTDMTELSSKQVRFVGSYSECEDRIEELEGDDSGEW